MYFIKYIIKICTRDSIEIKYLKKCVYTKKQFFISNEECIIPGKCIMWEHTYMYLYIQIFRDINNFNLFPLGQGTNTRAAKNAQNLTFFFLIPTSKILM